MAKQTMRVGLWPMRVMSFLVVLWLITLYLQFNVQSEAMKTQALCLFCTSLWIGLCVIRFSVIRTITSVRFSNVAEVALRYDMLFESGKLGNLVEGDNSTGCASFVQEGLRRSVSPYDRMYGIMITLNS